MSMLSEYIQGFINPYPNRYSRGDYEIRVLPHEDLDDDGVEKFWLFFSKFPNEFAAAVAANLPNDVEFVQYDHLANVLFAKKL